VLLCGLCGIWLSAIMIFRERSWRLLGVIAVDGLAAATICFGIWAALAGGAGLAYSSMIHSFMSGSGPYGAMYFSGPWHQFLYLLWIVGPFMAAMAAIGLFAALNARAGRLREHFAIREPMAGPFIAWVTAGFVAFASLGPNLQYLRIVSPVNAAYCLLAGLGFWSMLRAAGSILPAAPHRIVIALAVVALFAAGARDYLVFKDVVVRSGLEELSVSGIRFLMRR
jgi:hypothetical protein